MGIVFCIYLVAYSEVRGLIQGIRNQRVPHSLRVLCVHTNPVQIVSKGGWWDDVLIKANPTLAPYDLNAHAMHVWRPAEQRIVLVAWKTAVASKKADHPHV